MVVLFVTVLSICGNVSSGGNMCHNGHAFVIGES